MCYPLYTGVRCQLFFYKPNYKDPARIRMCSLSTYYNYNKFNYNTQGNLFSKRIKILPFSKYLFKNNAAILAN